MRSLSILFLSLFISLSAMAQVKHFIFQVNGTMVQGIPATNVKNIKKNEVISFSYQGRTRYFVVYAGMSDLIYALYSNNNNIIHFADEDPNIIKPILSAIKMKEKYKLNLIADDKLSTKIKITEKPFDLKSITTDEEVYFITSRKKDEKHVPGKNLIKVGEEIFFFESFEAAQTEQNRLISLGKNELANTYFTSEPEWQESMHKSEILASMILSHLTDNDFENQLSLEKKKSSDFHLKRGAKYKKYDFLEKRIELVTKGNRLSHCSIFNNYENKLDSTMSLGQCRNTLINISVDYAFDKESTTCSIKTYNQSLSKIELKSCMQLKQYQAISSYSKKYCTAFTKDHRKLINVSSSECDGHMIYVYDSKQDRFLFGEYSPNFANMSSSEVIRALEDVPTLKNIYKLWFPWDEDKTVGFSWASCRDSKYGYHPIAERNGKIREECEGDTFYSWGPQIKIDNLKKWMGHGSWQDTFRPLFMARTPIGSFGYGPISIRVKARNDLNWRRTTQSHKHCKTLTLTESKNTIFYRTMSLLGSYLLDITVCSPHTIESWSYGTKEHYDEIIKDYSWTILKQRTENYTELYINSSSLLRSSSVDGKDFRVSTLQGYIKKHFLTASSTGGEIFINPRYRKNYVRADHFATDYPIYFNER